MWLRSSPARGSAPVPPEVRPAMDAASRWRAPTGSGAARLLAAGCVIACCAAASRQHTYLNYTGDIILGALFPVHGRGRGGVECGRIQKEVGMQPLEAMLYTLQQINNSSELLPGIKLGMLAFDTCDSATYGLEQSLSFAKAFIAHQNEFHAQEFACSDGSAPRFRAGGLDKVVAVVGAQSSSVTVQVATMLQLFKVPQVSYMATSPALSNKERFPYFFRTVPSDINRAHAMLEILGKFNWTYVSVVYSDDAYGTHGFKILSELAVNYSICFSSQHRIESEATNQHEIVLREMKRKANLKVVVVFADKKTMQNLLTTANRLGLKNRFLWIVSDIWVANEKVRSSTESSPYTEMPNYEYESVLEGALAIQPLVAELKGFDSYFRSLNFDHRIENPWFEEYWMEYFNCSKKFKDVEPAEANETADKSAGRCGAAAGFSLGAGPYRQQHYLHFVRDAVHAVARALDAMRRRLCGAEPGLCRAMAHIDGEQLRDYLRDVSFLDDEGNQFEFLEGGDGPPRYSILNFQKSSDGNFYWRVVGNYTQTGSSDPVLIINEESVVHQNNGTLPIFTCNQPCADNQIKVLEVEERCCWTCRRCGEFEFRSDDYTCDTCPLGTRPGGDRSHCVDIPEQFVDGGSPWALAALCLAGAGVVLTALVAGVYRAHAETPVIKASGRELSYLLLCGILASFCATFAIAARPSGAACALARFLVGFSPALCYSAAVTRTNRVARIFAQQRARAVYKLRYYKKDIEEVSTPGKKRKKRPQEGKSLDTVDDFTVNAIRNAIYRMYAEGTVSKSWQDKSLQSAKRRTVGDGKRFIVVNAGGRTGFVPGAGLLFVSGQKTADYHGEMNGETFLMWFEDMLVHLEEPSVIIMDNASYHSTQVEKTPTTNWTKAALIAWLEKNGIKHENNLLKVELLRIAKQNKPRIRYEVDELARNYGHEILRLPPYHCHYNAIELVWAQCKHHYNSNVGRAKRFDNDSVAAIWKEALDASTPERYTSPRSQLVITGLLTLVEVVILASWLIFIPPRAGHIHPDRGARVLICEGFRNHSCLVALLYPFVLIAICTVYAFKTRKCPDGFNETKHIAFTNYTTIIIWLAFVPFYLASTSNGIRITSLAFSSSVSGLVQLACLFFPKLYIVLLKPQKNTRDGVMANHRSVICLPEPRVSGCSCSHQGSSSKNSDLNNSSCTQDNKIQRESTVGNKVQCLHQSRTERIGSEQPKEVKILATEGIQDGEV